MVYAPNVLYFWKVGLIFTSFSNKAAITLQKIAFSSMSQNKTKILPEHTLHPSYIPVCHFLDERHPIWSEVMGRCTPLLYNVQIVEASLLLLQIQCLHCNNNSMIHLDFHNEIQRFSCLHSWNITILLFFSLSSSTVKFLVIKMGIWTQIQLRMNNNTGKNHII